MLKLKSNLENLEAFVHHARNAARKANFPEIFVSQVELATEEAVVNIISYAYPDDTEGSITLACTTTPASITMQISDSGIPFNILECDTPDLDGNITERAIGGLGIFLMKRYMDEIRYKYENGQNILTLTK